MARTVMRVPGYWEHPIRDTIPPVDMDDARQVECNLMPLSSQQLEVLWSGHDCSHLQMYSTSDCEGLTPVSPPMPDEASLAQWLVDNNASSFGNFTATYDEWMACIEAGGDGCSIVNLGQPDQITGVAQTLVKKLNTSFDREFKE